MTFFNMRQLPVIPLPVTNDPAPWQLSVARRAWIAERVLELIYTAWDLQPFAADMNSSGPPFLWDADRRLLLRCELDAAFFHLYGIGRDDADYIMDTFHIVLGDDQAAYGEYRTERVILDIYDRMQRAIETGEPYQTLLDPALLIPGVATRRKRLVFLRSVL
jgi:hypothetical protein